MKTSTQNVQPQEVKVPKTVALVTFIQSLTIVFLTTAVAGVITGYFLGINLHSQARQAVVQDIQIVSKADQR